jgi:hypothetical protein
MAVRVRGDNCCQREDIGGVVERSCSLVSGDLIMMLLKLGPQSIYGSERQLSKTTNHSNHFHLVEFNFPQML